MRAGAVAAISSGFAHRLPKTLEIKDNSCTQTDVEVHAKEMKKKWTEKREASLVTSKRSRIKHSFKVVMKLFRRLRKKHRWLG